MTAPPFTKSALSGGQLGTDQTISQMSKMAMGEYGAGSPKIRALAIKVVRDANIMEKSAKGEISAIHEWIKKNIRYVKDPVDVEFVTYPETLAFTNPDGDCDDHVTLEAAMLGALGYPTRFVVIGTGPSGMNHVYLEVMLQGPKKISWWPLDPIVKDHDAGWSVPANEIKRKKVYPINTAGGVSVGGLPNIIMLGLAGFFVKKAIARLGWW